MNTSPATPTNLGAVDAHHHFWWAGTRPPNPRTPALDQSFTPTALERELADGEVERTVLVQCVAGHRENDRLAAYARDFAPVGAVVAWLPLDDAEAAGREIDRVGALTPLLRGFRAAIPQGAAVDTDLLAVMAVAERAGLLWEIVVTSESHVKLVEEVAAACPELRIVVDHLVTPPLAQGDRDTWRGWVDRLAALPSVAVKVSVGGDVLVDWEWDPEALAPYVGRALEAFGAERSMLASNWPVIRLATDHGTAWRALREAVGTVLGPESEVARVSGGTARHWYRIK